MQVMGGAPVYTAGEVCGKFKNTISDYHEYIFQFPHVPFSTIVSIQV